MKICKHFTLLVVFVIFGIGLGFAACVIATKFEGTWEREDNRYRLIINKNNFVLEPNNGNPHRGTFTFTENELELTTNQVLLNNHWTNSRSISTFQCTFTDMDTFVISQEDTSVGGILVGTYKKVSE